MADRWFVSLTVDTPAVSHLPPAENQGGVGVDLGVSACAALSTGEVKVGPKPHKALLKRLRRLSRSLSRKQKGSANRRKAKAKLARLPARSGNIRNDAQHKLTTDLTRRCRDCRGPMVREQQDMLGLRSSAEPSAAIGSRVDMLGLRHGA